MRISDSKFIYPLALLLAFRAVYAEPMQAPPNPPRMERGIDADGARLSVVRINIYEAEIPSDFTSYSAVESLLEPCEDLSGVTTIHADPSYSILQSEVVAQGASAFHLAHPDFADHALIINQSILPSPSSSVFFSSRLGYATEYQTAKLLVSDDSGASWNTLWSRSGSGDAGQSAFELVSAPLGDYAGSEILLRFSYEFDGTSAYTDTDTIAGWIIDDIQVGATLATQQYTAFGDPTTDEILAVEFINRARADAAAEAQRLKNTDDQDVLDAINFFNTDLDEMVAQFATLEQSLPPLAINAKLMAAARLHSQDMLENVFQGHDSSSNPPAPNEPGDTMGQRATRQGYDWSTVAENVYAYAESVWHAHAGFNIDWGDDAYGMQVPPGHRENIHSASFREIGVGIVTGSNSNGSTTVGPMLVTHDFGTEFNSDQPFMVGVTYIDHDGDGFYSVGEGLGGVEIRVTGAGHHAFSSSNGAYALPLPGDGEYSVSFSAYGYEKQSVQFTVSSSANVKIDYSAQPAAPWFADAFMIAAGSSPDSLSASAQIEYAGAAEDIGAAYSTDLATWTALPATVTALGGNSYRIDCEAPDEDFIALRLLMGL
jgi:uncharacterized protein YkwD